MKIKSVRTCLTILLLFVHAATASVLVEMQDETISLEPITRQNAALLTELYVRENLFGLVRSVAFSPDGRVLAVGGCRELTSSGCKHPIVRLWDARSGKEQAVLDGHTDTIKSVAFSPDGITLASGSFDGTVRLWNIESATETLVLNIGKTSEVTSVAFSPDSRFLAFGSWDNAVYLWDMVKKETRILGEHAKNVWSVGFSSDGMMLASGDDDGKVFLWDVTEVRGLAQVPRVLEGQTKEVRSVTFSSKEHILASSSWDGTVRIWDALTGNEISVLENETDTETGISFNSDGTVIAVATQENIRLWDWEQDSVIMVLKGHANSITSLSFNPDGSLLASGDIDGVVRLWGVPVSS